MTQKSENPNLIKTKIKWKGVCLEFRKQCNIKEKLICGKHCRERWINHLNPNIKK